MQRHLLISFPASVAIRACQNDFASLMDGHMPDWRRRCDLFNTSPQGRRGIGRTPIMSRPVPVYRPPTTVSMIDGQNEVRALRLLLAQRKLYSRAKRWSFLRWIGFSVIGVAAPKIGRAHV